MLEQTGSDEKRMGTRCQICTGCGRCVGVFPVKTQDATLKTSVAGGASSGGNAMRVVTGYGAGEGMLPVMSREGKRLVTVDLGTTTIAMQLYTQDGSVQAEHVNLNPQAEYGADVLSRIQAASEPAAALRMQKMVREVLETGLSRFREYLAPGESMYMVLAGNTTMIYLLSGDDPEELGKAPFCASKLQQRKCEIGGVPCLIFPAISAFVGGDITAGIYACRMQEREERTLLIDLGTNGEMVLGNKERRIACATAAGPAFEGGVNRGIWGADMVHLLARLCREGVIDETGLLKDPYFDEGIRIGDVRVTQSSIRAIQLAKAAIRAGIGILMKEYGLQDAGQIGRVVLAGGFGYYLDPQEAAQIALLPGELANKAVGVGNTALAGALGLGRRLLEADTQELRDVAFKEIADVVSGTEILNLAAHPDFESDYFQFMDFV